VSVSAERARPGPETTKRRNIREGHAITSNTHGRARRKAAHSKASPSRAKSKPHGRGGGLISCKKEVSFISGYISDQLANAERLAFEAHLCACPDCAAFLFTYRKTVELTRLFLQSRSSQSVPLKLALQR
jgi:hypothetical protein